jgi:ABC-type nitrate/sulfonate/bicarbonate transport system, ATPase component
MTDAVQEAAVAAHGQRQPTTEHAIRTAVERPGQVGAFNAVEAKGLTVTFETSKGSLHALGPIDLSVADGEFLAIVGPSGCGKSTFLRVAAGLRLPREGSLTLRLQRPANSVVPQATVFQDYGIFPWKTVQKNVEFGLRINGVDKKEARDVARHWISRLGLDGFASAYPGTLSGGMRQRVSIARALAVSPEILLMDEPFAALDAQLRSLLQEELLAIHQVEKRTVIFVTHSLDEALILADRVVVMSARPGRTIAERVVPFPRPRVDVRQHPEFGELHEQLWHDLKTQAQLAASAEDSGAGS